MQLNYAILLYSKLIVKLIQLPNTYGLAISPEVVDNYNDSPKVDIRKLYYHRLSI